MLYLLFSLQGTYYEQLSTVTFPFSRKNEKGVMNAPRLPKVLNAECNMKLKEDRQIGTKYFSLNSSSLTPPPFKAHGQTCKSLRYDNLRVQLALMTCQMDVIMIGKVLRGKRCDLSCQRL